MKLAQSLSLLISISNCPAAWAAETAEHFETTITKQVASEYLVVKPTGFDPHEDYPLLIFLHGRGEQGPDLSKVKIHGPFKKVAELQLPVILVAPQSPLDEFWDVDMLDALTEELIDQLPVDEDRVYLTGLSMGGTATWELAVRRPERFAAIVPICGRSVPSKAARLKNVAVWAFHGQRDRVTRVWETTNMVKALYESGNDARQTVYPEAKHDSWTETYNNPLLYQWLLKQRRNGDGDWPSDRRNGRSDGGDGDWPSDRRNPR